MLAVCIEAAEKLAKEDIECEVIDLRTILPWDRQIIYVTYNAVSNAIRRFKRPAYIAHRDFRPIDAWEDDAVARARHRKVAAE